MKDMNKLIKLSLVLFLLVILSFHKVSLASNSSKAPNAAEESQNVSKAYNNLNSQVNYSAGDTNGENKLPAENGNISGLRTKLGLDQLNKQKDEILKAIKVLPIPPELAKAQEILGYIQMGMPYIKMGLNALFSQAAVAPCPFSATFNFMGHFSTISLAMRIGVMFYDFLAQLDLYDRWIKSIKELKQANIQRNKEGKDAIPMDPTLYFDWMIQSNEIYVTNALITLAADTIDLIFMSLSLLMSGYEAAGN
ncbi:MAG: hypothetical protein HQK49_06060, partial [Oligoflexia bacterium]|nr:hypothetical protein [Oligoflexia bacterium]